MGITFNRLAFPALTQTTGSESKQNARLDYTFTVSGITWTGESSVGYSENLGITNGNLFDQYNRTDGSRSRSLTYNGETETAHGKGEIVFARSTGWFEFQIVLPVDIGPATSLVFNTLKISFV